MKVQKPRPPPPRPRSAAATVPRRKLRGTIRACGWCGCAGCARGRCRFPAAGEGVRVIAPPCHRRSPRTAGRRHNEDGASVIVGGGVWLVRRCGGVLVRAVVRDAVCFFFFFFFFFPARFALSSAMPLIVLVRVPRSDTGGDLWCDRPVCLWNPAGQSPVVACSFAALFVLLSACFSVASSAPGRASCVRATLACARACDGELQWRQCCPMGRGGGL